ncbi:hypothetical protein B0H13DRAFT_1885473 [Mycena leptocephala]|nr:hypothetical protein B0H13DRAFT_1885473 [Mycena leptocephala]
MANIERKSRRQRLLDPNKARRTDWHNASTCGGTIGNKFEMKHIDVYPPLSTWGWRGGTFRAGPSKRIACRTHEYVALRLLAGMPSGVSKIVESHGKHQKDRIRPIADEDNVVWREIGL